MLLLSGAVFLSRALLRAQKSAATLQYPLWEPVWSWQDSSRGNVVVSRLLLQHTGREGNAGGILSLWFWSS